MSFYANQKATAKKLMSSFEKSNMTLLLAQMQSGKTGTFLYTGCLMLHVGMVNRVVVFTGVPYNDLYEQLCDSVNDATKRFEYEKELETNSIHDKFITLTSSQLESFKIEPKTLVIWDESHYAQDTKNRPFAMFQNNGLLVDGSKETNELWKNKECYLLTVSATPFSEFVDCKEEKIHRQISKNIEVMNPGYSYRGVGFYYEHNLIKDSWDIFDSESRGPHKFVNLLEKSKITGFPQYGLLRCSGNSAGIIFLAKRAGWNKVVFYDMKNKAQLPGKWKTLEDQPEEDTLVVLKNMGRLGQVVPKQFVSFVFESSKGVSGTDTVLQSLLGRMCGYGPFNPHGIDIYICGNLTKKNELDDEVGIEMAHNARIVLKRKTQEKELKTYRTNPFVNEEDILNFMHNQRAEIDQLDIQHKEEIHYLKASEIERYINLLDRETTDVPRFAKNILRSKINQTSSGIIGYSTLPIEIKLEKSSSPYSEWTILEECAKIMNQPSGTKKLTNDLKVELVKVFIKLIETRKITFNDEKQDHEIKSLLETIIDETNDISVGDIINFGDLNSSSRNKQKLGLKMNEAIKHKMPYVNAVKQKNWRKNETEGKATRIQLEICGSYHSHPLCEGSVQTFNTTKTLYLSGYTYDASQHTKDKLKTQTIPNTTRNEVFHTDHELSQDASVTWINVIEDEDAFMGFIDTEFPANKKIRIVPTMSVPDSVIRHLNMLCYKNNGKFKLERITSKKTLKDRALRARNERYVVYFHTNTKLSLV